MQGGLEGKKGEERQKNRKTWRERANKRDVQKIQRKIT